MIESTQTRSSHAIVSTDAEGRVTAVSADASDVFGRSADDLIGRFVTDLVAPDDVSSLAEAYHTTLDSGSSVTRRVHIPMRTGPALAFEATTFAIRDAVGRAPALTLSLRRTADRPEAQSDAEASNEQAVRLQTVIDGAKMGTWEWYAPSGHVRHNARWAEMLGYTLDDIAPDMETWKRLVHPDDLDGALESFRQHLEQRTDLYSASYRLLHSDGHHVWVHDIGRVLESDDEGHPIRAAGIVLDITARVEAEAAARQHLAKFQSLFESQPMGVAVTDPEGNLVEVNHTAEEILGLSMAQQTERDIDDDAWAILRPDGSPMPPAEFASVRALEENRKVEGCELAIRRPDGTWRWLSVSAAPVDHPDYGVLISYTDVTEIKTKEARYRTIFDSIDDVIFTLDADHRYTEVFLSDGSTRWTEVMGASADELIGRDQREHFADQPEHGEAVDRALAGESVIYEWTPRGQASTRRIQTALSRIVDIAGRVIGVVGVGRDVTARAELEEARVEMETRTMALQKAESLAALAGGIAHDFNNLLSGVLLNAELASREVGTASRAHDLIDDVVEAAESASALSRQMLAYSGRGRFLVERIEPGDLLRSMRAPLATRLGTDRPLELNVSPDVPAIHADAAQVWQAVYNLIVNASEAVGEEGGRIAVHAAPVRRDEIQSHLRGDRSHLSGDTFVRISVEDSGSGVAEEVVERLFEPFITTKVEGRGLGLSAVFGITRAHGGAVLFEPRTDEGAAFHLFFPALDDGPPIPRPQATPSEESPRRTVLIVDDEDIVRRAGRRLLEALGYEVLEADDGDVALDVWEERGSEIDLVILDMMMPRLDGCDALAELRRRAPDLKVLMTSGYSEREVLARSGEHRPDGFIPKPFRLKQVEAAIDDLLSPEITAR